MQRIFGGSRNKSARSENLVLFYSRPLTGLVEINFDVLTLQRTNDLIPYLYQAKKKHLLPSPTGFSPVHIAMTKYPSSPKALRICDLGPGDQPREKLLAHGPRTLSDAEIVAILLGSGIPGASALDVARQLLFSVDHNLHDLARREVADLRRFKGVGKVRASRLVAAMELGRRREAALVREKPELANSEQCYQHLRPLLADLPHEEFYLLVLNRANRLLGSHLISRGGVTGTVADAKTIFRAALTHGSVTSLVLAHNHPSGQAFPSQADIRLTLKLRDGARNLDLYVLDHLIVAGEGYYSFADAGVLYPEED